MTRQLNHHLPANTLITKCIESIRDGDMYYVGYAPCMDHILDTTRLMMFNITETRDIQKMLVDFYRDPDIPTDAVCARSLGGKYHDGYTSCLSKVISVFNNEYFPMPITDRNNAIDIIMTSDKINPTDAIRTAINDPGTFFNYIIQTLINQPDILLRPCRVNDTGTPITCLQTLFDTTYFSSKAVFAIYDVLIQMLMKDSRLNEIAQLPIIVDDRYDTPISLYNWVSLNLNVFAQHSKPLGDMLTDMIFTGDRCTGDGNRSVSCIETLLQSSSYNVLKTLARSPDRISQFDHIHTLYNSANTPVTYLDSLIGTVADVFHAPITESSTNDERDAFDYARTVFDQLLTNTDATTSSPVCTTASGKHVSCIQKVIDAAIEHHQNSGYTDAIVTLLQSTPTLTRNACAADSTGTISCLDYTLQQITRSDELTEVLSENDNLIYPLLSDRLYAKLSPETRETVCSLIDSEFIRRRRWKLSGRDQINAVARCRCGDEYTPETRMCYDDLCFEISDASAGDDDDYGDDWVKEIIKSDEKFDLQVDDLQLNGVYTVNFVSANDPDTISKYIASVDAILTTIESKIPVSMTILNNVYEPLTGDIMITVTNHTDQSTSTHKLSRLSRIPAIKQAFAEYPGIAKSFNTLLTTKPSTTPQSMKLVISNRPYDMMRASTCQNWSSCLNLKDGCHRDTIHTFIEYGGYIAYLAKDEWAPQWFARQWILPTKRSQCVAVQPVYGLPEYKKILRDAVTVILAEKNLNTETCRYYSGDDIFPWLDDIRSESNVALFDTGYNNCMEADSTYDDAYDRVIENMSDDDYRETDEYDDRLEDLLDEYRDEYIAENDEEPDENTMHNMKDKFDDEALEYARDSYRPDYEDVRDEMRDYCDENAADYVPDDSDEFISGYDSWIDTRNVSVIESVAVDDIKRIRGENFITRSSTE